MLDHNIFCDNIPNVFIFVYKLIFMMLIHRNKWCFHLGPKRIVRTWPRLLWCCWNFLRCTQAVKYAVMLSSFYGVVIIKKLLCIAYIRNVINEWLYFALNHKVLRFFLNKTSRKQQEKYSWRLSSTNHKLIVIWSKRFFQILEVVRMEHSMKNYTKDTITNPNLFWFPEHWRNNTPELFQLFERL